MKKVHTNKGFTMAELLIVVAIIAILVAIAIPTFKDQLERAREGVDLSELRNGYSQAVAKFTTTKDTVYAHEMKFKQATSGWTIDVTEFPFDISDIMTSGPGSTLTLPSTANLKVYFTRIGSAVPGEWDSISASLTAPAYTSTATASVDNSTTPTEVTFTGISAPANVGGTPAYAVTAVTGLTSATASNCSWDGTSITVTGLTNSSVTEFAANNAYTVTFTVSYSDGSATQTGTITGTMTVTGN